MEIPNKIMTIISYPPFHTYFNYIMMDRKERMRYIIVDSNHKFILL
jgi:hypothetical protein